MLVERVHGSGTGRWISSLAAILLVLCTVARTRAAAAPHTGVRITDSLYDTRFISEKDGWAVGAFGTIVTTHDGGDSWRPQMSHTVENLFGIDFADPQHGWIVGRSGTVLHTNDGGETWEKQPTGIDRHLFKVKALDPQRVWVVGDWGTILATRDGGKTWENRTLDRDVILYDEAWPDAQHGWIVGETGTIVVTSDGGNTWTAQPSGVEKTLNGVFFADPQRGWAVGIDGLILRTTDGGQSWQLQHGNTEVGTLEQVGLKEAFDNPCLYDVSVMGNYGYAVGDIGAVFVSVDAGTTWQRKDMPSEWSLRWIRSVSLVSGTHGAFVGANGLVGRIVGDQVKLPEKENYATQTTD